MLRRLDEPVGLGRVPRERERVSGRWSVAALGAKPPDRYAGVAMEDAVRQPWRETLRTRRRHALHWHRRLLWGMTSHGKQLLSDPATNGVALSAGASACLTLSWGVIRYPCRAAAVPSVSTAMPPRLHQRASFCSLNTAGVFLPELAALSQDSRHPCHADRGSAFDSALRRRHLCFGEPPHALGAEPRHPRNTGTATTCGASRGARPTERHPLPRPVHADPLARAPKPCPCPASPGAYARVSRRASSSWRAPPPDSRAASSAAACSLSRGPIPATRSAGAPRISRGRRGEGMGPTCPAETSAAAAGACGGPARRAKLYGERMRGGTPGWSLGRRSGGGRTGGASPCRG